MKIDEAKKEREKKNWTNKSYSHLSHLISFWSCGHAELERTQRALCRLQYSSTIWTFNWFNWTNRVIDCLRVHISFMRDRVCVFVLPLYNFMYNSFTEYRYRCEREAKSIWKRQSDSMRPMWGKIWKKNDFTIYTSAYRLDVVVSKISTQNTYTWEKDLQFHVRRVRSRGVYHKQILMH